MTRQPPPNWDFGRMYQTLAYFDAIPGLNWFNALFSDQPQPDPNLDILPDGMLFDFREPNPLLLQLWGALDDIVMGGVSASQLQLSERSALFTGTISTANSGGFASVRTRNFASQARTGIDLSHYSGIELEVRGDGQRYKFFLRDRTQWDSTAFAASFDTVPNQWITIRIPFDSLTPVLRARTLPNTAPLNASSICSLQLMLSKFEYDGTLNPHFSDGEFALAIAWIRAC
jgi:Complex I intermediate-associated protein 30 (CIA30)